jgi:HK97 gp10 family phage protein
LSAIKFDVSDLGRFKTDAEKIAASLQKNERAAVMAGGMAYQRDVQRIAPVDTGQYRASIRTDAGEDMFRPVALIGTPMPQACRLEYGFFGPDKLGRVYNQKPRPHWRPPFDQNKAQYAAIMIARLGML